MQQLLVGNSVVIGSNSSVAAGSPQGIAIGGGNTANEGARVIGEQSNCHRGEIH